MAAIRQLHRFAFSENERDFSRLSSFETTLAVAKPMAGVMGRGENGGMVVSLKVVAMVVAVVVAVVIAVVMSVIGVLVEVARVPSVTVIVVEVAVVDMVIDW